MKAWWRVILMGIALLLHGCALVSCKAAPAMEWADSSAGGVVSQMPKTPEPKGNQDCAVMMDVVVVDEDATALVLTSSCWEKEIILALNDAQVRELVAYLLHTQGKQQEL